MDIRHVSKKETLWVKYNILSGWNLLRIINIICERNDVFLFVFEHLTKEAFDVVHISDTPFQFACLPNIIDSDL